MDVQIRYFCEEDVQVAMQNLAKLSSPLHTLSVGMSRTSVRRRGRPPKNGPVATDEQFDLTWQIMVEEEKVILLREQAGCFVLLTNIPQDTPEAAGVSLCSET